MDLSLQIVQKQILSTRMQQSVEILQMNTLSLEEYVQELVEVNPLLDWMEEQKTEENEKNKILQKLEWLAESDEQNRNFYRTEKEEDGTNENQFSKKDDETLREYLLFQVNILKIESERLREVLLFFAESVDERGYMEEEALADARMRFSLEEGQLEQALEQFQSMDPAGVGARNLRECLLIQLGRNGASDLAVQIAQNYLESLAKNQMAGIAKKLQTTVEDVLDAVQEIRDCKPKPGSGFSGNEVVEYVLPDVFVEKTAEGTLEVSINEQGMPKIHVSSAYVNLLRAGTTADTEEYISKKLRQAEWIMQCISKRESTLLSTARSIVTFQEAFFLERDGQIAPLRMVDVADDIQMHESTVSRAVRGKYVQCDRGTFPLDQFFAVALADKGGGSVSADSIKQRIRQLIEEEEKTKPLSDQKLADILQADGTEISRRTVAKYREAMGIGKASVRKMF